MHLKSKCYKFLKNSKTKKTYYFLTKIIISGQARRNKKAYHKSLLFSMRKSVCARIVNTHTCTHTHVHTRIDLDVEMKWMRGDKMLLCCCCCCCWRVLKKMGQTWLKLNFCSSPWKMITFQKWGNRRDPFIFMSNFELKKKILLNFDRKQKKLRKRYFYPSSFSILK